MNFAAVVGLCSVWAMPFLRNNLQRHTRNQSAGDPLIEGETLFRVGHPPLVLQIGKGDAGHQRVPMQAGPGPAFEVAEPKFLLELLVHLLAGATRLDGGDQPAQRGPLRQMGWTTPTASMCHTV